MEKKVMTKARERRRIAIFSFPFSCAFVQHWMYSCINDCVEAFQFAFVLLKISSKLAIGWKSIDRIIMKTKIEFRFFVNSMEKDKNLIKSSTNLFRLHSKFYRFFHFSFYWECVWHQRLSIHCNWFFFFILFSLCSLVAAMYNRFDCATGSI